MVPMVRHGTAKNQLGTRMDRPQPTPHSPKVKRYRKSAISPSPINGATQDSQIPKNTAQMIRQHTPPILRLLRCLRTTKRKRATPIMHMGPRHQAKTRSSNNPYKQNHPTLTN